MLAGFALFRACLVYLVSISPLSIGYGVLLLRSHLSAREKRVAGAVIRRIGGDAKRPSGQIPSAGKPPVLRTGGAVQAVVRRFATRAVLRLVLRFLGRCYAACVACAVYKVPVGVRAMLCLAT